MTTPVLLLVLVLATASAGVPAEIRDQVPNGNCAGFVCGDEDICIPSSYVCDNEYDCFHGEDEAYCNKDDDQKLADNLIHVEVSKKSQLLRSRNSLKGHQEKNTSRCCYAGEYNCGNDDYCIPLHWVCDGTYDCYYGGDESNCWSYGYKKEQKSADILIDVEVSEKSQILRSFKGPQEKYSSSGCYGGEYDCGYHDICIPSAWWCDGIYDCYYGGDEADCNNNNNITSNAMQKSQETQLSQSLKEGKEDNNTTRNGDCGWGNYDCGSNDICVPNWYVCDQYVDCYYGEDEANC